MVFTLIESGLLRGDQEGVLEGSLQLDQEGVWMDLWVAKGIE